MSETSAKPDIPSFMEPLDRRLIIRLDRAPTRMALGRADEGGVMLEIPEAAQGKPRTGVVVGRATDAHPKFSIGRRLIFAPGSGTVLGESGEYKLLRSEDVLMLLDGEEPMSDYMGTSWAKHAVPPPGKLLVRRAEMPLAVSRVIVPDGVARHTRSSEAEVLKYTSSTSGGGFLAPGQAVGAARLVGQNVFLEGTVSRKVVFGSRDEDVLWTARPDEVAAILHDVPADGVHAKPDDGMPAAMADVLVEADLASEPVFDEGSSESPQ